MLLRERLTFLNGQLTIESLDGRGTRVNVDIPTVELFRMICLDIWLQGVQFSFMIIIRDKSIQSPTIGKYPLENR